MTSLDSNFLCGRPHGANPSPRPREPEPNPLCVDVINGWPQGFTRQHTWFSSDTGTDSDGSIFSFDLDNHGAKGIDSPRLPAVGILTIHTHRVGNWSWMRSVYPVPVIDVMTVCSMGCSFSTGWLLGVGLHRLNCGKLAARRHEWSKRVWQVGTEF